ncbi:MAG: aa3-type cytochrome c oxidase subunit IV [Pseudomonadota bacterium]
MGESKHEHGKMEIGDQEKTFAGFMRFTTNTTIGIIVFLIFLYLIAG